MRHMAAVFARQFNHSSFDKRGDSGNLPQICHTPRHEPVFRRFCGVHIWTVLIRANNCNKKSAWDSIFLSQAPIRPCLASFAVYLASFLPPKVRQIRFLKG